MRHVIATAGTFFSLIPLSVLAHEGHGHTDAGSPLHYIAEPLHALVFAVAVAIIGGLLYRYLKQSKKS